MDTEKMYTRFLLVIKYGISGCIGAAIQLMADYLCVEYLGRSYLVGTVAGFLVAVVISFLLQKYWTFGDTLQNRMPRQLLFYGIIALGSLVGNVVLMSFFVSVLQLWYIEAQIYTIGIVTGISFVCNNLVTFKEHNFFTSTRVNEYEKVETQKRESGSGKF